MKMTTTPPASWTGNLFRRPPLGVYTVTGSPEDAVMRCLDLWVAIGVREYTHGMPQQFALRGWVGMEITVDASSTATKMSSLELPDLMGAVSDAVSVAVSGTGTLLHLAYEATAPEGLRAVTDTVGEVASFVGSAAYEGATSVANKVGGLVSGLAAKSGYKERLPKPGKCRIVVAACPLPDQEKEAAQLWCFLTDEVTKRAFGSDDQVNEAFQWFERKLNKQNVLLDAPHYVNQNDLPDDSVLRAESLAAMRRAASAEPHS